MIDNIGKNMSILKKDNCTSIISKENNKKKLNNKNNIPNLNIINLNYINNRINMEICDDTINKLKDLYLIDEYRKCKSVKNEIKKLELILEKYNIETEKKELILNGFQKYRKIFRRY